MLFFLPLAHSSEQQLSLSLLAQLAETDGGNLLRIRLEPLLIAIGKRNQDN
jgi:hypothetical protein